MNRAILLLRKTECKETSLWWLKAAYNWTYSCWSLRYFCHQNERYKLNGLFVQFSREAVKCIIKFFALSPPHVSVLQHHVQTPRFLFDVMHDRENAMEVQRVFMSACYLYDYNWIWGWKSSEIRLQFEFLELICCKMQFYIFHCVYIQWSLLGLRNVSVQRTTSEASGGCVSDSDSATE